MKTEAGKKIASVAAKIEKLIMAAQEAKNELEELMKGHQEKEEGGK